MPRAVREVLIPKKRRGQFRPLGIPCIRDRVAQTSAMLLLSPIFEADLQAEQYGYRPKRSAKDAVNRVHSLLNRGYHEVVDCDLSNYFGEIPHAELMRSLARRISDGRMLALVKAWLEMPVERGDGKGGSLRTDRARKGTPQGSPISSLLSNVYMRRFIVGCKVLGFADRLDAQIVCYAEDLCILCKAPATEMLTVVKRLMAAIKLPINERKTRCLHCPQESFVFLGYRIGWNYRLNGQAYIGTRPSPASVQSVCRKISEQTSCRYGQMDTQCLVKRLNRILSGWSNYFQLGQVSPAYHAVDRHATRRLRQWLCRKHKVKVGKYVRYPNERLWYDYGLIPLWRTTKDFPWAKSLSQTKAGCRNYVKLTIMLSCSSSG